MAGHIAWMIAGCAIWQRDGLRPPAAVQDATEEYMNEEAEDCLAMWLEDCCTADASARTKHSDLYASYRLYAERSSEKPMTSKQLGKEFKALKYQTERTKAARFVVGLKIKSFKPQAVVKQALPAPPY